MDGGKETSQCGWEVFRRQERTECEGKQVTRVGCWLKGRMRTVTDDSLMLPNANTYYFKLFYYS